MKKHDAQTRLMVYKNMQLYRRSTVATMGMLGVGMVFLILLRLMQLSVEANTKEWSERNGYTEHPTAVAAGLKRAWSCALILRPPCHVSSEKAMDRHNHSNGHYDYRRIP